MFVLSTLRIGLAAVCKQQWVSGLLHRQVEKVELTSGRSCLQKPREAQLIRGERDCRQALKRLKHTKNRGAAQRIGLLNNDCGAACRPDSSYCTCQ